MVRLCLACRVPNLPSAGRDPYNTTRFPDPSIRSFFDAFPLSHFPLCIFSYYLPSDFISSHDYISRSVSHHIFCSPHLSLTLRPIMPRNPTSYIPHPSIHQPIHARPLLIYTFSLRLSLFLTAFLINVSLCHPIYSTYIYKATYLPTVHIACNIMSILMDFRILQISLLAVLYMFKTYHLVLYLTYV